MNTNIKAIGFKATKNDYTVYDKSTIKANTIYTIPIDSKIAMCSNGYHMATKFDDIFTVYPMNIRPKVFNCKALGDIVNSELTTAVVCSSIEIENEIPLKDWGQWISEDNHYLLLEWCCLMQSIPLWVTKVLEGGVWSSVIEKLYHNGLNKVNYNLNYLYMYRKYFI